MRYALIEDNKVVQIDCNSRDGFIEVDDSVRCGMLYDGENFSNPPPQSLSIQQQIDALEAQQTPRLIREALSGGSYALSKMAEIDADIASLRESL